MNDTYERSRPNKAPYFVLALLVMMGAIGVIVTTASDIDLGTATATSNLSPEETAYYEYVAPRLDRLVTEVDHVVVMVEGRSRDILALSVSGNRIEELTRQITGYGRENGVPERFNSVHDRIRLATNTTSDTFGQAREALRTFDFSNMSNLLTEFQAAANELHDAQSEIRRIGGIEDA